MVIHKTVLYIKRVLHFSLQLSPDILAQTDTYRPKETLHRIRGMRHVEVRQHTKNDYVLLTRKVIRGVDGRDEPSVTWRTSGAP